MKEYYSEERKDMKRVGTKDEMLDTEPVEKMVVKKDVEMVESLV